jgi:hypothetical protein
MDEKNHYARETVRLRKIAVESRLKAIKSQLSALFTLCGVAETAIKFGQPDEAIKLVNKIARHAETIRAHLDEPNHVPRNAKSDLRKQLAEIKKRVEKVGLCLHQL